MMKTRETQLFSRGLNMDQLKDKTLLVPMTQLLSVAKLRAVEGYIPEENIRKIRAARIIEMARVARIIDERDRYALADKLALCVGKDIVIVIDAVDDEPYISSQMAAIMYNEELVRRGIDLIVKATGAKTCFIEVYLKNCGDEVKKIFPKKLGDYKIKAINAKYPAEIRTSSTLHKFRGNTFMYIGACAVMHLARAVFEGVYHQTTIVTVAGNAVANPQNIEVEFGLPLTELFDRCGFSKEPTRIVVGGPLTGRTIDDLSKETIGISTHGVLAMYENSHYTRFSCIRCGDCADVCPSKLSPMMLYNSIMISRPKEEIEKLDPQMCIGCMCCSYVCPSRLPLEHTIAEYNNARKENL